MGGDGSGRRETKKIVVEDCLILDVGRVGPDGPLRPGLQSSGTMSWNRGSASIGFHVNTTNPSDSWLNLSYTISDTGEKIECRNELVTTRVCSGGLRWFFLCPLITNGQPCRARVHKLYLPPGARSFGCRRYYDLTYTSCQEHDKGFDALRKLLR
jgi:hypothetical protein